MRSSVDRWSLLEDGWDGADSIAPRGEVISAARRLLVIFELALLPIPTGYVAGDGEIGFRWKAGDGYASISLLDDGSVLGFCRPHAGAVPIRLDADLSYQADLSEFIEGVSFIR